MNTADESALKKYLVTTICFQKDGSQKVSTEYRPEVQIVSNQNITDSMKMLTSINFADPKQRPKSCLMSINGDELT